MALKDIVLKLVVDGKESLVTLDKLDKSTLGLGKTFKNVAGAMGLAFGAHEVISFMKDSVALVQKENEVIGKLNATLKSTNHAAGLMSDELIELAQHLEEVNNFKFDDKDIIDAEGLLLTFTKINKQIFPETIQLAMDMSVRFEQDLKSSIIQIGKALQEPEKGITALRRVGVTFTDQQEKLIQSLIKENDLLGAQKIIMAELSTQISGSAAASVDEYTTKVNRLNDALEDVQKTLGQIVTGGGIGMLDYLEGLFKAGSMAGAMMYLKTKQQQSNYKPSTQTDFLNEARLRAKGDIQGKSDSDIKKMIAKNKAMYNASFMGTDLMGNVLDPEGNLAMLQAKLGVYESALIKSDDKVKDKKKDNAEDFYKHLEKLEKDYLDWEREVNKNNSERYRDNANLADMTLRGKRIYKDPESLAQLGASGGNLQQVNFQLSAMDMSINAIREGFDSAGQAAVSAGVSTIRVFKQSNSVLQIFINALVQATIQALALKSVSSLIGLIFGGTAGAAAVTAIPALASGGIVKNPTLGLVGEAGPEAIVPLDKFANFNGSNSNRIESLLESNLKAMNEWADRLQFEFDYDSFKTAQKKYKTREDYRI